MNLKSKANRETLQKHTGMNEEQVLYKVYSTRGGRDHDKVYLHTWKLFATCRPFQNPNQRVSYLVLGEFEIIDFIPETDDISYSFITGHDLKQHVEYGFLRRLCNSSERKHGFSKLADLKKSSSCKNYLSCISNETDKLFESVFRYGKYCQVFDGKDGSKYYLTSKGKEIKVKRNEVEKVDRKMIGTKAV